MAGVMAFVLHTRVGSQCSLKIFETCPVGETELVVNVSLVFPLHLSVMGSRFVDLYTLDLY